VSAFLAIGDLGVAYGVLAASMRIVVVLHVRGAVVIVLE
jgi:hypothetical protein